MHVRLPRIKVQLANANATSHILFGCVVWGHWFGMQLHFHGASRTSGSVGKLEALYRASLRWALAARKSICGISLYLLVATLPLHRLIIKATVRYFEGLEHDKHRFAEITVSQRRALPPLCWAADFV